MGQAGCYRLEPVISVLKIASDITFFLTIGIYYDVLHIILENNVKSGTIVKRSGAPWASDVTYRVVQRF